MHSPNFDPFNAFHERKSTAARSRFLTIPVTLRLSVGSQAQYWPSIRVASVKSTVGCTFPSPKLPGYTMLGVATVVKIPLGVMKNGTCCGQHTNHSTLSRKNDIPAKKVSCRLLGCCTVTAVRVRHCPLSSSRCDELCHPFGSTHLQISQSCHTVYHLQQPAFN
ncbi:hypothetical protein EV401DRAFT_410633 [Pisolithus croceorrhizus]|nr:hypothetical protein EV401DRAFT_410633 [Pisolithus croceorrhizus]